jgi:hypothetical protein
MVEASKESMQTRIRREKGTLTRNIDVECVVSFYVREASYSASMLTSSPFLRHCQNEQEHGQRQGTGWQKAIVIVLLEILKFQVPALGTELKSSGGGGGSEREDPDEHSVALSGAGLNRFARESLPSISSSISESELDP